MKVYVDASIVLRRVLNQPGAFLNWDEWEWVVTSELLRVETLRSLDRLRLQVTLPAEQLLIAEKMALLRSILVSLERVPLHAEVLERAASPLPTVLGTLDAIHLATALLWTEDHQEPLTFLTHDRELALAARACGLEVKTSS